MITYVIFGLVLGSERVVNVFLLVQQLRRRRCNRNGNIALPRRLISSPFAPPSFWLLLHVLIA